MQPAADDPPPTDTPDHSLPVVPVPADNRNTAPSHADADALNDGPTEPQPSLGAHDGTAPDTDNPRPSADNDSNEPEIGPQPAVHTLNVKEEGGAASMDQVNGQQGQQMDLVEHVSGSYAAGGEGSGIQPDDSTDWVIDPEHELKRVKVRVPCACLLHTSKQFVPRANRSLS